MVMSVYAPDSKKSLEMCEECIANVITVLRECRKGGALDLHIAGDIKAELGLVYTIKNEEEELTKLYGPLMFARVRQGPWRFQKNHVVWNYERIWL